VYTCNGRKDLGENLHLSNSTTENIAHVKITYNLIQFSNELLKSTHLKIIHLKIAHCRLRHFWVVNCNGAIWPIIFPQTPFAFPHQFASSWSSPKKIVVVHRATISTERPVCFFCWHEAVLFNALPAGKLWNSVKKWIKLKRNRKIHGNSFSGFFSTQFFWTLPKNGYVYPEHISNTERIRNVELSFISSLKRPNSKNTLCSCSFFLSFFCCSID